MSQEMFRMFRNRIGLSQTTGANINICIPEKLMHKCPRCGHTEFFEKFESQNGVCGSCGYHSRLTAKKRLEITADEDTFVSWDDSLRSCNPIDFPGYNQKLDKLESSTGLGDAVITGRCHIEGQPCAIGVMDSNFMMASMGSVVGEKITRTFEYACEERLPVILFTASGGARMQEGIIALMQMAKTSGAIARHSDKNLLYITVLTDPTTGGVAASFAALGDIIIAEPKIQIGFAGRRVIEGTIKQKLPDDFQTSEFFLKHGFIDMIVKREEIRSYLGTLLRIHRATERRRSA